MFEPRPFLLVYPVRGRSAALPVSMNGAPVVDGFTTHRHDSRGLREALEPVCDPVHPEDEKISGVHHAIWRDSPSTGNADGRGALFYADKAIDRSPGSTGTSARMAQLNGKGRLKVGDTFRQESLIGTVFEGRVEADAEIRPFKGIKPGVGGWARVIGHKTIFVDDRDPLAHGFQIQ